MGKTKPEKTLHDTLFITLPHTIKQRLSERERERKSYTR